MQFTDTSNINVGDCVKIFGTVTLQPVLGIYGEKYIVIENKNPINPRKTVRVHVLNIQQLCSY